MSSWKGTVALVLGGWLLGGCATSGCVTFDGLALGTQWGTPAGHSPGTVVHSEDSIDVSVQNFASGAFNHARVDPAFMGPGNSVRTNNICLEFDFSSLKPDVVWLVFQDKGGTENISVNGSPIATGNLTSGSGGGTTWSVYDTSVPGGREGIVLIRGPVERLRIGGQEFWIDCVCAHKK